MRPFSAPRPFEGGAQARIPPPMAQGGSGLPADSMAARGRWAFSAFSSRGPLQRWPAAWKVSRDG
jgi:hypothetical protein